MKGTETMPAWPMASSRTRTPPRHSPVRSYVVQGGGEGDESQASSRGGALFGVRSLSRLGDGEPGRGVPFEAARGVSFYDERV